MISRKKYTNRQTKKITSKSKTKSKNKSSKSGLKLGCHVSISPSILEGIQWGVSIGASAIQLFLGSNRSASMKTKAKPTPDEIHSIRSYIRQMNITLIIHSIYLLNFCVAGPSSGRVGYMHSNLQYDLQLGAKLGAKCVVLHLGFKKDMEPSIALGNLIANLNKILREMPVGIQLAIETSAGQGSQVGYTLEELAVIWRGIKHHGSRKVGICIDTAHIFVSGYDISTPEGIKSYLARFNELIGWKHITNFHINDSRFAVGSRKDEHRGIGSGLIFHGKSGHDALKYLIKFCNTHQIPMILETHSAGSPTSEGSHSGEHGYKWELNLLQGMLKRGSGR